MDNSQKGGGGSSKLISELKIYKLLYEAHSRNRDCKIPLYEIRHFTDSSVRTLQRYFQELQACGTVFIESIRFSETNTDDPSDAHICVRGFTLADGSKIFDLVNLYDDLELYFKDFDDFLEYYSEPLPDKNLQKLRRTTLLMDLLLRKRDRLRTLDWKTVNELLSDYDIAFAYEYDTKDCLPVFFSSKWKAEQWYSELESSASAATMQRDMRDVLEAYGEEEYAEDFNEFFTD